MRDHMHALPTPDNYAGSHEENVANLLEPGERWQGEYHFKQSFVGLPPRASELPPHIEAVDQTLWDHLLTPPEHTVVGNKEGGATIITLTRVENSKLNLLQKFVNVRPEHRNELGHGNDAGMYGYLDDVERFKRFRAKAASTRKNPLGDDEWLYYANLKLLAAYTIPGKDVSGEDMQWMKEYLMEREAMKQEREEDTGTVRERMWDDKRLSSGKYLGDLADKCADQQLWDPLQHRIGEKILIHGTSEQGADGIPLTGFHAKRRGLLGDHTTYFAKDIAKSDQYLISSSHRFAKNFGLHHVPALWSRVEVRTPGGERRDTLVKGDRKSVV